MNMTAREQFILDEIKKGFSVAEVMVLLERNGFEPITRSRIYQILQENGIPVPTAKETSA